MRGRQCKVSTTRAASSRAAAASAAAAAAAAAVVAGAAAVVTFAADATIAALAAAVHAACREQQGEHVQERQEESEDPIQHESQAAVDVALCDIGSKREQARPTTNVLVHELWQVEFVDETLERLELRLLLVQQRHVQAQLHDWERHAHQEERCEGDRQSNNQGQRRPTCEAARDLCLSLSNLGRLPRIRGKARQGDSQGRNRGANAEDCEAGETQPQVHLALQVRRLIQAAKETQHQDVCEHIWGSPLGDRLHCKDAAPRPADLSRSTSALQRLAQDQQHDLDGRDGHGIGGDKGCGQNHAAIS
mmetsp:Transcript_20410/g.51024  ORF Transcript_20410/g.51024 Transcript_20410/m.51024 type:complete len:305 (+) Transcript_20410:301-1215(+)